MASDAVELHGFGAELTTTVVDRLLPQTPTLADELQSRVGPREADIITQRVRLAFDEIPTEVVRLKPRTRTLRDLVVAAFRGPPIWMKALL